MGALRDIYGVYTGIQDRKAKSRAAQAKSQPQKDYESGISSESGMPQYKRGGKVKRTGAAMVHKGEHVMTAGQYRRMKRRGKR